MIQGTASHVGKSVLTAAFCRILKRKGYSVAPFKAQNMSNNSYVTKDGGEMGRAQAVQAEACGLAPSVLMNPVLLKPDTDKKAQVVALGKVAARVSSIGDAGYQRRFLPVVQDALEKLMNAYEVVVIEGAGSCAEINLKKRDLVNMSIAKSVKAPVILVGNIDWGGIFAQLVGTFELLDREEKKLVKAFIVNKFRGEIKLLQPGIDWIKKRTKRKVMGVIPYIRDLGLAEEDSITGQGLEPENGRTHKKYFIDVLWLPRISNFTDFEPLKKHKDIRLRYLPKPDPHTLPDLLIVPGTKSTIADLKYLYRSGLADHVKRAHAAGVPVLGICGGYQMLGGKIYDSAGVESEDQEIQGLGLLPIATTYERKKRTVQVKARHLESGTDISGYEIHMGQTRMLKKMPSFSRILEEGGKKKESFDGALMKTKHSFGSSWVAGTYLHGLFDTPAFLRVLLAQIEKKSGSNGFSKLGRTDKKPVINVYDRLADIIETHLDIAYFESLLA